MKSYLMAAAVLLGLGATACGGNNCEEAADRINDRIETCGGTVPTAADAAEENAGNDQCTDADEEAANKAADDFDAVDCAVIKETYPPKS